VAEIAVEWLLIEASDADLALASYGQRGTDLLIETPSSGGRTIEFVLPHLQAKGYRVTVAHPERDSRLVRDHQWLKALAEQGLLLAVNAEALLTGRGSGRGRGARRLCGEGLVRASATRSAPPRWFR
jgi:tyrosine-protein phosphatase YwqE